MKTIKPIIWILNPVWAPCMVCKTEQSVNEVFIGGLYHLTLCEKCSRLSEEELKSKLFRANRQTYTAGRVRPL